MEGENEKEIETEKTDTLPPWMWLDAKKLRNKTYEIKHKMMQQ